MNINAAKIFKPVQTNIIPGETFKQETVAKHIDNNFLLVVNKIVRSKSQTRLIDMKNYYHSLCNDNTTAA